jgi:tetratricopeptide (TPR) repeat protein
MGRSLLKRTMIVAVIALLPFAACNRGSRKGPTEVSETPQDREKTELMTQIDRDFENSDAHYKLGQLYQNDGLWSKALHEYNVAVSFDPAHRNAQAATIYVLQAMGDKARADMTADTYIMQTSGSAEESLRLALAFQKEKLDDLALRAYQQALRLAPNSAKVNRQIGYYYLSKGDKVRAREYLYRSFQLNRKQPEVAGELGRLGVDISGARLQSGKSVDKIVTEADKEITAGP